MRVHTRNTNKEVQPRRGSSVGFFVFFRDKVEKLEVILGRTFRKMNSSSEQIFGVEKYWIHEKFNTDTFDNDIGK